MKRFAGKIVVFLVIFKVFDFLIYSFFLWARLTNISLETDYGSLNRLYQGLINADIVAFGSSRVYLHVNPEVLRKTTGRAAWNVAMDGSNFEQHYFTLEEYLLHNRTPQIVIFEADLASLDPAPLRFKKELFLPYRNHSVHTMQLISPDWETRWGYWIVSSAIYKQEIPPMINHPERIIDRMTSDRFAYETLTKSAVDVKLETNDSYLIDGALIMKGQVPNVLPASLPFAVPQRHFDLSKSLQRMQGFEKLAQLAEQKGFVLVLLMSPYLDGEVEESQRSFAIDFYTDLSERYPSVYFLDFSSAEPFSRDITLWWNIGHLNVSGANLLSNKIGNAVNRLLSIR